MKVVKSKKMKMKRIPASRTLSVSKVSVSLRPGADRIRLFLKIPLPIRFHFGTDSWNGQGPFHTYLASKG